MSRPHTIVADPATLENPEAVAKIAEAIDDPTPQDVLDTIYAPQPLREPSEYERAILAGLQRQTHVYQGNVDPVTIAERRARNKAARIARRVNRRAK